MDLAIVCLLIIFFFSLNGECFKKFSLFGSKGSPSPSSGDSQCTCTCRPQVQTRYVAIEVPKMIPAPSPPPPPPPPPPVVHPPKKTHIISIQEVEIPIVKPPPPDSTSWSSPTPPTSLPGWTDRRWDEEANYQSSDSYDYNKMSNYGDDLASELKDEPID